MIYELAAELKLAGFPQAGNGKWIGSPSTLVLRSSDRVYVPTLEELIEACGHPFFLHSYTAHYWYARNAMNSEAKEGKGTSPLEAVARLWLTLYANTGASA